MSSVDIIDTIIDDGVSAYKVMFFSRPHHTKFEELILSQGIDHIIVTHGDRLFRKVADGLSVREILAKNNISILYVREEQIDTTAPEGSIFVLFKKGIAQYTSDLTSLKVRASMKRNAEAGKRKTNGLLLRMLTHR